MGLALRPLGLVVNDRLYRLEIYNSPILASLGCAKYIYPSAPKNRDFVNSTLTKLEIAEVWTIYNFNLVLAVNQPHDFF